MSEHTMIVLARMTGTLDRPWEIKGPFPAFCDISSIIADLSANPRYDVVTAVHGGHLEEVVRLLEEDVVTGKLSPALCLLEMHKSNIFSLPDYGDYSGSDDDSLEDEFMDEDDGDDELPPFLPT